MIFYAMRIGSVIFTALCIFLAMKLLPEKNALSALIAAMPMFLCETASVSADGVLYGICILVSCYILSLSSDSSNSSNGGELTSGQIAVLLFMAAVIGLCKQIYGTIMLLYFLIPVQRMRNRKRYFMFGALLLAVCLASSLIWTYMSMVRVNAAGAISKDADVNSQIEFIKSDPLGVLIIFIRSNIKDLRYYAASFVGILGWLNVIMPLWFYILYAVLIVYAAFSGKLNISMRHRLIMITGFSATLFALDLYLYITWTMPCSQSLIGIQGRYFIPMALVILPALSCMKRLKLKYENFIVFSGSLLSFALTITATYMMFYAGNW